jgi:hypothetical protein
VFYDFITMRISALMLCTEIEASIQIGQQLNAPQFQTKTWNNPPSGRELCLGRERIVRKKTTAFVWNHISLPVLTMQMFSHALFLFVTSAT